MSRLKCSPFPRRPFLHVRCDLVPSFPLSSWSETYIYIYIYIYPGQGLMPVNVCVHFRNFFTLNDYDAPVETVAKAKVLSK